LRSARVPCQLRGMEPGPEQPLEDRIAEEILRQTASCAPGRSVCPTDVARALEADWHSVLSRVRRVAVGMARAGRIDILRKGKPVSPDLAKGVIRLRARPAGVTGPLPADTAEPAA